MHSIRSQRWRDRRSRYVDNLSIIDPKSYAVDVIVPAKARAFIAAHHYLPAWPAAQLAVGLFEVRGRSMTLAGVAVFAVPTTANVITRHSGFDDARRGCVLARFVLLDSVAGNGESWFLSRAFAQLRIEKPGIEAVVSYADPAAGHVGQCYAALSSAYRGQMPERTAYRVGARPIAGRSLSKIRLGEPGCGGAIDQLVALGLPRPQSTDLPANWLARMHREHRIVRATHPGLHAYCFELTRHARRAAAGLPRRGYPKVIAEPHPELALFAPATALEEGSTNG